QTDTCQTGTCTGSNPVVCAALSQCHDVGTCDAATGACSTPAKSNGTACTDGNACTQTDTCQTGICTGSNPVVCAALSQCHDVGTCAPVTGACSTPTKANGATCSDGDACTQTDTCQTGTCTGGNPVVCTAKNECHAAGTCDSATGTCSEPAKPDGTPCTSGACRDGACLAPDAGASPDAGAAPDAGGGSGPRSLYSCYGCSAAGPGAWAMWIAVAVLLARRRGGSVPRGR
ncbi:MAG: MYXO-CTERM sorting domain-containing protein, partial [Myxococcaceae bacterium]